MYDVLNQRLLEAGTTLLCIPPPAGGGGGGDSGGGEGASTSLLRFPYRGAATGLEADASAPLAFFMSVTITRWFPSVTVNHASLDSRLHAHACTAGGNRACTVSEWNQAVVFACAVSALNAVAKASNAELDPVEIASQTSRAIQLPPVDELNGAMKSEE